MKKSLLLFLSIFIGVSMFSQECSDLFISEYVEGSGTNKAIELFNPTNEPINMETYQLVRYSNGGTIPYGVALGGTIQPKSTFVVVLDKRDPNGTGQDVPVDIALQMKADTFLCPVYEVNRMMYFNGNDAVTLEKLDGTIIDIIGKVGPPMTSDDNGWGNLNDTTIIWNSGGVPTEYTIQNYIVGPLFWLSWTENNTLIRKYDITQGVKQNPDPYFIVDMEWDSLPSNTFDSLGFHNCQCTYLDIDEKDILSNIRIYPNPVTNGLFSIDSEEPIDKIEIFDITGKLIEVKEFGERNESVQINLGNNLKGLYLLKTSLKSGQILTKKLLFK
ncbi:MAG: hypothetical protein C0591_03290 [Marinilabiliales bacterium]|nr:MAG: hypothetical protein C0591_03290 [Marinilabiliales bacterium]